MIRLALLIAVVPMLGSCESMIIRSAREEVAEKQKVFAPQLSTYVDCNVYASASIARQSGDPVSLAIAARGMCGREFADLRTAVDSVHKPEISLRIMDGVQKAAIEMNASTIVKTRAGDFNRSP